MTRRQKEPAPEQLLRFIAEHESLRLTCDEFPSLSEERVRATLRELAESCARAKESLAQSPTAAEPRPPRTARKKGDAALFEVLCGGASRGNPGPAGAGWIIRAPGGELLQEGHAFLGKKTDNEAEYEALIRALQAAAALGARDVLLKSDSELLVRQVNGQYQLHNARLQLLHRTAREVIQAFHRFEVRHVRSEQSDGAAASLAERAIDEAPKR